MGATGMNGPVRVPNVRGAAPRWWCHCFMRFENGECDCEPGEAPWLTDPAATADNPATPSTENEVTQ
jgi:hypothetical protein